MSRSRGWNYDVSGTTPRPLVPYRPSHALRRLQSCPAMVEQTPHLQMVFGERFSSPKTYSPRGPLMGDDLFERPDDLLEDMRDSNNHLKKGRVTVSLSETSDTCQSISQAVQSAYAALDANGGSLHIAPEIVRTGIVGELDHHFQVLPSDRNGRDLCKVQTGDIVLLPAFGTTPADVQAVRSKGAEVVTTICPSVLADSESPSFTTVIHGSFKSMESCPDSGNYIFVRDLEEAHFLGNYILCGGDYFAFKRKFKGAVSHGFDPRTMVNAIAFTSQERCVHASKEAGEIEDLLRAAMIEKYGIDRMDDHFVALNDGDECMEDDEVMSEVNKHAYHKVDMIVVIGSFESKRARRLQHIAKLARVSTYWIDDPDCIHVERNAITWQDSRRRIGSTFGFLPQGETLVGVVRDPDVSDCVVEKTLEKIYMIQNEDS